MEVERTGKQDARAPQPQSVPTLREFTDEEIARLAELIRLLDLCDRRAKARAAEQQKKEAA
jgi:hypothetical protein